MNKLTTLELWTGGKLDYPHFTLFLNIAHKRINEELFPQAKQKLDDHRTSDSIGYKLKKFLWKGDLTDKNSTERQINETEKKIIREILQLLNDVRNFHSHYIHDNSALKLSNTLERFLTDLYQRAKNEVIVAHSKSDMSVYEKHEKRNPIIDKKTGSPFLTKAGRLFFLSLFLYRSEMSILLQHHKGTKRNDLPEFRVTQDIYSYYCRRDGEARRNYGQQDSVIKTLPLEEQTKILNGKQAYKIISYLNDLPQTLNSPDNFPLFIDGNKLFCDDEYFKFCQQNRLFIEFTSISTYFENQNKDDKPNPTDYHSKFEITFKNGINSIKLILHRDSLHKIIIDAINRPNSQNFVLDKINSFIQDRHELTKIIKSGTIHFDENREGLLSPNQFLDEYYRYKLRGTNELRIKMGKWLTALADLKESNKDLKLKQLQIEFLEEIEQAPLVLSYYDFYFEKEYSKPRAKDRFLEFSINYLIDHGYCKNVLWLCETFNEDLKPAKYQKMKRNKTPYCQYMERPIEGWRLKLNNNHGLFKLDNAGDYEFAISERAIKNLIIPIIHNGFNDFFVKLNHQIVGDLKKIDESKILDQEKLRYLKREYLPPYIINEPENDIKKTIKNRILFIIGEILPFLDNKDTTSPYSKFFDLLPIEIQQRVRDKEERIKRRPLKKAEKNEQIMRCYQYFDWIYPNDPNDKFKFLRKNEYNNMSILHYSLASKHELKAKLLSNKENGIDIAMRLPKVIEEVIFDLGKFEKDTEKCNHIDVLLRKISKITINRLNSWIEDAATETSFKKAKWKNRLRAIGISERRQIKSEKEIKVRHPLSVHPNMVTEICMPNFNGSVSAYFRNEKNKYSEHYCNGLNDELYNIEPYLDLIVKTSPENEKKERKRVVNLSNEEKLYDMVLWQIAKEYLYKSDEELKNTIIQQLTSGNEMMKVTGLHTSSLSKKINFDMENGKALETVTIEFNIKFHQLDDYLFKRNEETLEKAARQIYMRHCEEMKDGIREVPILKTISEEKKLYSTDYNSLIQEFQRVYNESLYMICNFLHWEKNIFSQKDQSFIMEEARKEMGLPRIGFQKVCELADFNSEDSKMLIEIRNGALHAEIPKKSYKEIYNDPRFMEIFNLVKRKEKRDYTSNNERKSTP